MQAKRIYDALFAKFGPQKWWPGDSPWEVAVGALLTQNTNWRNVEKAIANLKSGELLDPKLIMDSENSLIEEAIRPSGYFRVKTQRLRNLCVWWLANVDSKNRFNTHPDDLQYWRDSLLSVKGIGKESADSILLYSFNLPSFVIDTYTKRIMARHFGTPPMMKYDELRLIFMKDLPRDPLIFNEFHALFVRLAKELCRKNECLPDCPLRKLSKSPHLSPVYYTHFA